MQSVVLRHRTLEPTSHRLELSLEGDRCRATIKRLLQNGPIVSEFPAESLKDVPDLAVGVSRRLGVLRLERLSDVYHLRFRQGSVERDCLFVSREELGLALMRLMEEAGRPKAA